MKLAGGISLTLFPSVFLITLKLSLKKMIKKEQTIRKYNNVENLLFVCLSSLSQRTFKKMCFL